MSTTRISASSYSNTAPLIWSFLYGTNRGRFELILDNAPARSAELLAQNRIDAALVPVIEYQRLDNILLVPEVCVGARESVRSVCLVTKGADLKDVRSVALDVSSKTSVALTRIIFREFIGHEPEFQPARPDVGAMLAAHDCALLIGDPALIIEDGQILADGARVRKFDLAETWREFTGFGFVFAMWMAHREKLPTAGAIDFAAARDEGLTHLDEIISNYEGEISLPREDFREYLSANISYTVDETMRRGLELYHQLAFKHHLVPANRPLEFIG
jgi:chorismate dehydratase